MAQLKNIELPRIWSFFEEICRIPRLSKKEDKIIQYLISFSRKTVWNSNRIKQVIC